MKRCSQCGTEVDDDLAVSCPNCGSTFAPTGRGIPYSPSPMQDGSVVSPPVKKLSFSEKLRRALRGSRKEEGG